MLMNILITNDDGIASPGLWKLAEAAQRYGKVWIVAPDGERSAMSHSYTWRESVKIWPVSSMVEGAEAYACSGTPTDCVRVGVLKLLPDKPDVVMAGINSGFNISHDIQYSATVGSVLEAAFWNIHAIAFSQGSVEYQDVVDQYLLNIMEECLKRPLEKGQVWNVNFPRCELSDCKGIRWDCRVSQDPFYVDTYEEESEVDGKKSLRLVYGRNWNGSEGTDLRAIIENYISVGKVNNIG